MLGEEPRLASLILESSGTDAELEFSFSCCWHTTVDVDTMCRSMEFWRTLRCVI